MSPTSKRNLQTPGVLMFKQARKIYVVKGKGKKTIPQEIVELPKNMTMVDYELMTSKRDFNYQFEGTDKIHSS
jgi:hypothetical protein